MATRPEPWQIEPAPSGIASATVLGTGSGGVVMHRATTWVERTGDEMSGDLTMRGGAIIGITPTGSDPVLTARASGDVSDNFEIRGDGSAWWGGDTNFSRPSAGMIHLGTTSSSAGLILPNDPPNASAAARKSYVDFMFQNATLGSASAAFVRRDGDTMTGALVIDTSVEDNNAWLHIDGDYWYGYIRSTANGSGGIGQVITGLIDSEFRFFMFNDGQMQWISSGLSAGTSLKLDEGGSGADPNNLYTENQIRSGQNFPVHDRHFSQKIYVDWSSASAVASGFARASAYVDMLIAASGHTHTELDLRYAQTASAESITGTWDFSAKLPLASTSPTASGHLVHKQYVDDQLSLASGNAAASFLTATQGDSRYAQTASAESITGLWDFSAQIPIASATPTASGHLVHKRYVDDQIAAASAQSFTKQEASDIFVNASGDTMTGALSMASAQIRLFDAKVVSHGGGMDVYSVEGSNIFAGLVDIDSGLSYFEISGQGSSGAINWGNALSGSAQRSLTLTPAWGTNTQYLMLTGASGGSPVHRSIRIASDPLDDSDLSRKAYVDAQISLASGNAAASFLTATQGDSRYAQTASAEAITGLWDFSANLPLASTSPTASGHLVHKMYVDAASAAALASALASDIATSTYDARYAQNASAESISGAWDFVGVVPTTDAGPTASSSLTRRKYVDDSIATASANAAGSFVEIAGDIMTGTLTVDPGVTASSAPTASGHLTNKLYVDAQISLASGNAAASFLTATQGDARYAQTASAESITGTWDFSGVVPTTDTGPVASSSLTRKKYVDDSITDAVATASANAAGSFVELNGDIMLGMLTVDPGVTASSAPTASGHLTNKKYVDDQLAGKASAAHKHPLSDLLESGAASGQVPKWNPGASAWVPADDLTGGAGGLTFADTDPRYAENASAEVIVGAWDFVGVVPTTDTGPTASSSLTRKKYVDDSIAAAVATASANAAGSFVELAGDIMIGTLTVDPGVTASSAPTASGHLTNKLYVDNAVALASGNAAASFLTANQGDARYAQTASAESITGLWDFSSKLPLASTTPTASGHLVHKKFVDDSIATASANAAGSFSILGHSHALGDLTDVDAASPASGSLLSWISGEWTDSTDIPAEVVFGTGPLTGAKIGSYWNGLDQFMAIADRSRWGTAGQYALLQGRLGYDNNTYLNGVGNLQLRAVGTTKATVDANGLSLLAGLAFDGTNINAPTLLANNSTVVQRIDTTVSPLPITLPASPTEGRVFLLVDAEGTWGSNGISIDPNGNTITGSALNLDIERDYANVLLIYNSDAGDWSAFFDAAVITGELTELSTSISSVSTALADFESETDRKFNFELAEKADRLHIHPQYAQSGPFCIISASADNASLMTTGSTPILIPSSFANVNVEDDCGMWDATNSRMHIRKTGWYEVAALLSWDPNTTGARAVLVGKNSAGTWSEDNNVCTSTTAPYASFVNRTPGRQDVYLQAGDYLEFFGLQNSGSTRTLQGVKGQGDFYISARFIRP